ncbi:MAG TPA: uridine kinase [Pseudohaliea sp.]|nr:uridine kinase [Pseudohaliea sp.]
MTPCIIAIAGPSGSGKSLFAQTLVRAVRETAPGLRLSVIAEDAYYRDQSGLPLAKREQVNYDHPDALEQELLGEHLQALRAGCPVAVPVYDYARHTRSAQTREVAPAPVILVEGILLLANPALRALFDIRFYVDTPLDLCLLRRIERDLATRGRSLESIIRQYEQSVRPMYHTFIRPSAEHADMVITGGGRNTVAVDVVRRLVQTHAPGAAGA